MATADVAQVGAVEGTTPRRWTRDEYWRLAELGFFDDQRVELIGGEAASQKMGAIREESAGPLRTILRQHGGRERLRQRRQRRADPLALVARRDDHGDGPGRARSSARAVVRALYCPHPGESATEGR